MSDLMTWEVHTGAVIPFARRGILERFWMERGAESCDWSMDSQGCHVARVLAPVKPADDFLQLVQVYARKFGNDRAIEVTRW